jgi:hypothetical protein
MDPILSTTQRYRTRQCTPQMPALQAVRRCQAAMTAPPTDATQPVSTPGTSAPYTAHHTTCACQHSIVPGTSTGEQRPHQHPSLCRREPACSRLSPTAAVTTADLKLNITACSMATKRKGNKGMQESELARLPGRAVPSAQREQVEPTHPNTATCSAAVTTTLSRSFHTVLHDP